MKGQTDNKGQYAKGYLRGYRAGMQAAINILEHMQNSDGKPYETILAESREIYKSCFEEGQTDSAQDQRGPSPR